MNAPKVHLSSLQNSSYLAAHADASHVSIKTKMKMKGFRLASISILKSTLVAALHLQVSPLTEQLR